MTLLKIFIPIIIIGTIILTLVMLPVCFVRKKNNPRDSKNTLFRLVFLSFVATTIIILLLGSGLIMMYLNE